MRGSRQVEGLRDERIAGQEKKSRGCTHQKARDDTAQQKKRNTKRRSAGTAHSRQISPPTLLIASLRPLEFSWRRHEGTRQCEGEPSSQSEDQMSPSANNSFTNLLVDLYDCFFSRSLCEVNLIFFFFVYVFPFYGFFFLTRPFCAFFSPSFRRCPLYARQAQIHLTHGST